MDKPRDDFPLWWRSDPRRKDGGYWCKAVGGKKVGFGSNPEQAEKLLNEYMDALSAGDDPNLSYHNITLADLYAEYVSAQHTRALARKIKAREFEDSRRFLDHFVAFAVATTRAADVGPKLFTEYYRTRLVPNFGPDQINKRIYTIRKMFDHCADADLIEHRIKFGPEFKPVDRKTIEMMKTRSTSPRKLDRRPYTPTQVRRLIRHAPIPLKAMILLGINCAFGPTDCGLFTLDHLRLKKRSYHTFPRPKNRAVERRCYLWPETVQAINEWLSVRIKKIEPTKRRRRSLVAERHRELVFLTRFGKPFVVEEVKRDGDQIVGVTTHQQPYNLQPDYKKPDNASYNPAL